MKKYLSKALLRGGIPFVVLAGISLILKYQGKLDDARSTFVVSFIALFVGAATVIYEIDKWNTAEKIGAHFLLMCLTVYPTLLFSGWFTINTFPDAIKVFVCFVLVGLLILAVYGIIHFIIRKFRKD